MARVVHFEIQASHPEQLAVFYRELFGWKIARWGEAPYWLVDTGDAAKPGINGGLLPRRGSAVASPSRRCGSRPSAGSPT